MFELWAETAFGWLLVVVTPDYEEAVDFGVRLVDSGFHRVRMFDADGRMVAFP